MKNIIATLLAATTFTLAVVDTAHATIFRKDYHDAGVWNAYDDSKESYSMKFTDDGSKDGFWLVVSPGENPKTNVNQYAVLYGDRKANRITAYSYDGKNSANSFKTGDYLATFENAFSDGGVIGKYGPSTMFSIDVSGINDAFGDAMWNGVSFGEQQGIWFHQSSGSDFSYGADGSISNYTFGGQMWLDTKDVATNTVNCNKNAGSKYYCKTPTTSTRPPGQVPAPGGLALVLLGLAGFGMRRRRG